MYQNFEKLDDDQINFDSFINIFSVVNINHNGFVSIDILNIYINIDYHVDRP